MQHQDILELLALDLYDELDAADRARLDAHLADCAACRAFARELESGLGRLAANDVEGALPADWRARLQREVELTAPRGRLTSSFAVGGVAGLAAGLLIAWGIIVALPQSSSPRPSTYVASNESAASFPAFDSASDAAPPKAQAGGELARFQRYLRK